MNNAANNFDDDDIVPEHILRKGLLSWDEIQLIKYTREHPEELQRLIDGFKKAGENK